MLTRRNLLKTMLAAPAVIRSGVLMPAVPLVAAAPAGGTITLSNDDGDYFWRFSGGHSDCGDVILFEPHVDGPRIIDYVMWDRRLSDAESAAVTSAGFNLISAWSGAVLTR